MRAFIAIPLTENVHKKLYCLQEKLKRSHADIRWVSPVNMHITLKFLGTVDYKKIRSLSHKIREHINSYNSFNISILNVGAFPDLLYPQTIWAGVCSHKKSACYILQEKIEVCASELGFGESKKKFFPHITIGRVSSQKNIKELRAELEKEKNFSIDAKIPVTKIAIFSCLVTPLGPVYSRLAEFPLPEAC